MPDRVRTIVRMGLPPAGLVVLSVVVGYGCLHGLGAAALLVVLAAHSFWERVAAALNLHVMSGPPAFQTRRGRGP